MAQSVAVGHMSPRMLDLFCGAGGAGMGYHRAGWDVVGVDLMPQPRYPFEFIQGDALEFLDAGQWAGFDAVHASPPCQAYSSMRHLPWMRGNVYWDSIPPTLERLQALPIPWVLENVERSDIDGITLCGTMFGLAWADGVEVFRHRRFQSSEFLLAPGHPKHTSVYTPARDGMATRGRMVEGRRLNHGYLIGGKPNANVEPKWSYAMGIDWMRPKEIAQAIPPAYTQFLGGELMTRYRTRAMLEVIA
jgi:DNA (cytosine-5)-methyltransferase 1